MTISMTIACSRRALPSLLSLGLLALSTPADAEPSCNKPGRYPVKIDSAPQGATITVDGCPPMGVTPWSGKLDSGAYMITLAAPGYERATRPFKVKRSRRAQELFVPLVKKIVTAPPHRPPALPPPPPTTPLPPTPAPTP